jgi:predicted transcriptional regulator
MKLQLNLSIEEALVKRLEAMAAAEHRSKSNMLEVILRDTFEIDDVIRRDEASDAKK